VQKRKKKSKIKHKNKRTRSKGDGFVFSIAGVHGVGKTTVYLLLKKKQKVVIFPEGTYYRGKVGKGKSRLIKMILKFQEEEHHSGPIPFVPVGVIYQKKRLRPKVMISIGEPLYAERESDAEVFTQKIMGEIARLSDMG